MATKVGVFDSGIGGQSIALAIRKALPELEVISVGDREHLPYGDKSPDQMLGYVTPILQKMVGQGCTAIVIACNTVTTNIITQLRETITVPLIGIEPMVRPAAKLTKTGIIAVCATPATLSSPRYSWLKRNYATGIKVLEPDCSQWAYMVENNKVNKIQIKQQLNDICAQGADVIVLGCTHYHWIKEDIQHYVGDKIAVVQPEDAVVRRLKTVLTDHGLIGTVRQ